jgi:hypothetical protein
MRAMREQRRIGVRSRFRFLPRLDERGVGLALSMVALAAAGIVSTMIVVVSLNARQHIRWSTGRQGLVRIDSAVTRFHAAVGAYPSSLQQLYSRISTAQTNVCGSAFTSTQVSGWQGPYLQQIVPSTGAWIAIGIADVPLARYPSKKTLESVILSVTGVRSGDALRMDAEFDDSDGSDDGKIRWGSADSEGEVEISYYIPATSC